MTLINYRDLVGVKAQKRLNLGGERELRSYRDLPVEVRDDSGNTLVGHFSVYNTWTNIGNWFLERVAPGAFDKTIKEADVRHLLNHNPDIVLGRTKSGTLRLGSDEQGGTYEVDLNMEDPDAISTRAKVARGDIDQSSFAFRVLKEEWEEAADDSQLPKRTIVEAELFDTSTVTYPAYEDSDSGLRMAGLSILSQVLGLRDEVRYAMLRALESDDLPKDIEGAVEQFVELMRNTEISSLDGVEDEPAVDETPDDRAADEALEEDEDEEIPSDFEVMGAAETVRRRLYILNKKKEKTVD